MKKFSISQFKVQEHLKKVRLTLVCILNLSESSLRERLDDYNASDITDSRINDTIQEAIVFNRIGVFLKYIDCYYIHYLCYPEFREDIHRYVTEEYKENTRVHIMKKHFRCEICGQNLDNGEIHHLIPLVYGGSDKSFNVITVCSRCHKLDPFEAIFNPLRRMRI